MVGERQKLITHTYTIFFEMSHEIWACSSLIYIVLHFQALKIIVLQTIPINYCHEKTLFTTSHACK